MGESRNLKIKTAPSVRRTKRRFKLPAGIKPRRAQVKRSVAAKLGALRKGQKLKATTKPTKPAKAKKKTTAKRKKKT